MIDTTKIDQYIIGRVEPQIYAFSTETVPNYLKVGDTYRPVEQRLDEWRRHFPNLEKCYEAIAKVSDDTYFRDFAVHYFLEQDLKLHRLEPTDIMGLPYYSKEFFQNATEANIKEAITDIKKHFDENKDKYQYYTFEERPTQTTYHFKRGDKLYDLRPNQKETVDNFIKATNHGRTNLLMYAVMRFGKTFTALSCAQTSNKYKKILVVSGKADVLTEWKRTVESVKNFEGFDFIESRDLLRNQHIVQETLDHHHRAVVFLTLQDLSSAQIKKKHEDIFSSQWDMLIVDETHFGARAAEYGKVLRLKNKTDTKAELKYAETTEDYEDNEDFKLLKAGVRLHLSGTPYRILMGSEFQKEDIIAFYQFTDIVRDKDAWDEKHLGEELDEWENPYYGFPQMIRFAFNVNESSMRKMEQLRKNKIAFALNELLRPVSTTKTDEGLHLKFEHEQEVLSLLKAIDGTEQDDNVLAFLDYDNIKRGKLCRHVVCVLPYRASCDAMESLIRANAGTFKNLGQYEILNISGVDDERKYGKTHDVIDAIGKFEAEDKKTLTLTVNRMLTGTTVEQWDTMIYLKDTASPQEYDQATFRLQNQYIREYTDERGRVIKYNMKPQTLLVDFEPGRMFRMQESKSQIYNANVDKRGNTKLEQRIKEELRISPIIVVNKDKMEQVEPKDILDAVREYSANKSIMDEASDIPVDGALLDNRVILDALKQLSPIGSKKGIFEKAVKGKGKDINTGEDEEDNDKESLSNGNKSTEESEEQKLLKKLSTYYSLILFFSFLTDSRVKSLDDILKTLSINADNQRIARNVGLDVDVLSTLKKHINLFVLRDLDYKIDNINTLAKDTSIDVSERADRAMRKFGRLSTSEVVTPPEIAAMMVDKLPQNKITGKTIILDIASKQGEFANALYKKFGRKVKKHVYSLPTSPLTYELTRKVYSLLGLPIENIIEKYNTYDIIYGENKMKVMDTIQAIDPDVIIGNPPYMGSAVGDQKTYNDPIYNLYLDEAYKVAGIVEMIHPARFLSNAGGTPKPWNRKMLLDPCLNIVYYKSKSNEVFDDTDIKGGVVVSVREKGVEKGPIELFTPFPELNAILQKISKREDFISMSDIVITRTAYRFTELMHQDYPEALSQLSEGHPYDVSTNIFERLPQVFYDEKPEEGKEYIQILGRINNDRTYKYVRREYIRPVVNLDYYKVFLSKANGTGAFGETLTPPISAKPGVGNTESFISIGKFTSEYETYSLKKYISTKFVRALLGALKTTQDITPDKWQYVPQQNFTALSDIDWDLSVDQINNLLYEKYGLTLEERDFINRNVKPME